MLFVTGLFTGIDIAVWMLNFIYDRPVDPSRLAAAAGALRFVRTLFAATAAMLLWTRAVDRVDMELVGTSLWVMVLADWFRNYETNLGWAALLLVVVLGLLIVRNTRGLWTALGSEQQGMIARGHVVSGLVGYGFLGSLLVSQRDALEAAGVLYQATGYGFLMTTAVVTGWGAILVGRLPVVNATISAFALTLLLFGDIVTAVSTAMEGQLLGEAVGITADLFYGPALILVALSAAHLSSETPVDLTSSKSPP